MLTAAQAKNLFATFIKELGFDEAKVPRWFATVNTVMVELLQHTESLVEKTDKTLQVVVALANDVRVMRQYLEKQGVVFSAPAGVPSGKRPVRQAAPPPPPPAPEEPVEEEIAGAPDDGGVRIGADGTPMDPQQAAIEAEMDAASGAAPAPQARTRVAGQAPRAKNGGSNGGALPLDPEARQAAIEAQMDEASK